ncbi:TPA: hypothetical protein EYP26_04670 [Candidatus Bathyarchaeota archaeon]|nr:hypothetical protein [Candidatus Bathyarchaeota archaeon]
MVYLKKVNFYVDEKLRAKFKEAVLRKRGTLRKLSGEVESLLRSSLIEESLGEPLKKSIVVKALTFPGEVKRGRPKLKGPPSEILIQEMRGRRTDEGMPR